jgi:hypothetical protein
MWFLSMKVVVPSRCAVGHTARETALVINRNGEDSPL